MPAWPGKSWEGKVDYIYPELDLQSRTLRVRLEFPNPERRLKPNMFAEVKIYGGPQRDTLLIPAEALIRTGERDTVVTALGDGRFQPVDVVVGARSNGSVEILSGLEAGDEVWFCHGGLGHEPGKPRCCADGPRYRAGGPCRRR